MLRVGLTGGLGSGKSTVAAMFARRGVHILEADAIGRELMQPGQPAYQDLLAHFRQYPDAPLLVLPDGSLDRLALANYVFSTHRLGELNRIVHPAVIAEQDRRMAAISEKCPEAIAMVESALIFEADAAGTAPGFRQRFDQLILVTAPEELRIARYVEKLRHGRTLSPQEQYALQQDARRRIAMQIPDEHKSAECQFVIQNDASMQALEQRVEHVFEQLGSLAESRESLQ